MSITKKQLIEFAIEATRSWCPVCGPMEAAFPGIVHGAECPLRGLGWKDKETK